MMQEVRVRVDLKHPNPEAAGDLVRRNSDAKASARVAIHDGT